MTRKRATTGLATGLAAAAVVAGPALMKIGNGRVGASLVDTAEPAEACIQSATDVFQRANGADVGIKLAKGTRVEKLSERGDWARVSYSKGGRGRVGWISADALGDCSQPPVVAHAPKEADEANEPGEEEDGDWSNFNGCPLSGNAKQALALSINPLKNRFDAPKTVSSKITLAEILAPGDDTTRWSTQDAATIEGWIIYVKKGGIESCNCKSKDPQFMDTHIGLAATPNETRENHQMIVEVTPRFRAIMSERGEDWSTEKLASTLTGKHVRITGWMLFDGEHVNMAENTTPNHPGNWRATAWEIHPVTSIEVLP